MKSFRNLKRFSGIIFTTILNKNLATIYRFDDECKSLIEETLIISISIKNFMNYLNKTDIKGNKFQKRVAD